MLFKNYHIYPMHIGLKTVTRRMWKTVHVTRGKWYPVTHKMFYDPEDIIGEIYIEDIYKKSLGSMTEKDAYDEGGYTVEQYKKVLTEITKKEWDAFAHPYVIKFRFKLSDTIDSNGGTAMIDEYKQLYDNHMKRLNGD